MFYPPSIFIALKSPSTRRAWIEIPLSGLDDLVILVALHPEGVDRNLAANPVVLAIAVALHPEGVDRNRRGE